MDQVCAGDPLFTVGLTAMALRARNENPDYIDFWCERLALANARRRLLHLYVAVFCIDFLAEIGHTFNRDRALPPDPALIARYHEILETELAES